MGNLGDHLAHKASQLGLEREQTLAQAQGVLEQLFPAQTRVVSLSEGTLRIITPNASVASELRLRQVALLKQLGPDITKLQIHIRELRGHLN